MVADALFALAGYGVLNAIGILRGALWEFVAAVGLAFLTGVASSSRLGLHFSRWEFRSGCPPSWRFRPRPSWPEWRCGEIGCMPFVGPASASSH